MIVENSMARIREVLYSSNDDKRAALIALAKEDANNLAALIEFAKDNKFTRDDPKRAIPCIAEDNRKMAVEALGELAENHDDARKALIEIVENGNEHEYVRWRAAAGLGKPAEKHDDARKALIEIAMNGNEDSCDVAIIRLGPLAENHDDARKALIEIAKNGDENKQGRGRGRAIKALGELAENHDDALEALCWVAQNEQDNDVRLMAIFALELLAETHEDARKALITAAKNDCFAPIRERAVISLKPLAKTNANARATLITVAKNDGDIDVRKRAIEGLAPLAAEHEDARKALIDIAQWKEKLRNDTWSSWSIIGLRVSAIAGLIPLAEKMSEEDCLALDEASADLIRDVNQAIRFNTELSGIVSYFSQLAPRYGDACKGLIKIAQNDPNVHLRNEAAAALKSLETQETQTTIGSLAEQRQQLDQFQR